MTTITIAAHPHHYLGQYVENGQCVRHVQIVAGIGHTSLWRRGERVRGSDCVKGTVIATFDEAGAYANAIDGSSHAALFIAEHSNGLVVVDQWQGQFVHERVIRFKNGEGKACNDGDRFYVVELDE